MSEAPSKRDQALTAFAALLGLPPLAGLTQRGRDATTAQFTLHLADGRKVRIGTIRTLRSQAELAGVLAVAIDCYPQPVERKDWQTAISVLMTRAKDVDEAPGESFADSVREWASRYSARATSDRDGAAPRGEPFVDDEQLHLTASGLARYVRREYSEQIRLADLRTALADVGFERITVRYNRNSNGTGNDRNRSSTSYYRLALATLDPGQGSDDAG